MKVNIVPINSLPAALDWDKLMDDNAIVHYNNNMN